MDAASEAPSSPVWREARLRGIGASNNDLNGRLRAVTEATQLVTSPVRVYGTARSNTISGSIPNHLTRQHQSSSPAGSWKFGTNSISALVNSERRPSFFKTLRHRPSAYDSPLVKRFADGDDHTAEKINGVRVWYSSFQSIDWLHDAVSSTFLNPSIIAGPLHGRLRIYLVFVGSVTEDLGKDDWRSYSIVSRGGS